MQTKQIILKSCRSLVQKREPDCSHGNYSETWPHSGAQSPGDGGSICRADYRAYDPQEPLGKVLQSSQLRASGNSALNKTDELNADIFAIFLLLLEERSV